MYAWEFTDLKNKHERLQRQVRHLTGLVEALVADRDDECPEGWSRCRRVGLNGYTKDNKCYALQGGSGWWHLYTPDGGFRKDPVAGYLAFPNAHEAASHARTVWSGAFE
jgi:hypothetical protein